MIIASFDEDRRRQPLDNADKKDGEQRLMTQTTANKQGANNHPVCMEGVIKRAVNVLRPGNWLTAGRPATNQPQVERGLSVVRQYADEQRSFVDD